jgi:hypothetical protein
MRKLLVNSKDHIFQKMGVQLAISRITGQVRTSLHVSGLPVNQELSLAVAEEAERRD